MGAANLTECRVYLTDPEGMLHNVETAILADSAGGGAAYIFYLPVEGHSGYWITDEPEMVFTTRSTIPAFRHSRPAATGGSSSTTRLSGKTGSTGVSRSTNLRPGPDRAEGDEERGLVAGGEDHPPALDPEDLCGGEVHDHRDILPRQFVGGVELRDPADHLAFLAAEVDDEFVEFL